MFKSVFSVPLSPGAEKADLKGWIYNLTSRQYRNCSRSHIAMGISRDDDGSLVLINAEYVSMTIMVHHYKEIFAGKSGIKFISERSKGYLLGFIPLFFSVIWGLSIRPSGKGASDLACSIEVTLLSKKWIGFIANPLIAFLINRHNREETPNFARSIIDSSADKFKVCSSG